MRVLKSLLICTAAVGMLSACGSSKSATSGSTKDGYVIQEQKIEENECEKLESEKPNMRAAADAYHHDASVAKRQATVRARAALAENMSAKITSALEESNIGYDKFTMDTESNTDLGVDEGQKLISTIRSVAKETVSNTAVIKTSRFREPSPNGRGRFHVYVCVELQGGSAQVAQKVRQKLEQQVPDEDRLKMEYQFQKFEEKIQKDLEEME